MYTAFNNHLTVYFDDKGADHQLKPPFTSYRVSDGDRRLLVLKGLQFLFPAVALATSGEVAKQQYQCRLLKKSLVFVSLTPSVTNNYSKKERCGGLMVTAVDSRSSGAGSSPGRGHCVAFLGKKHYSHSIVPLSTQVYKWVPANLMLGATL